MADPVLGSQGKDTAEVVVVTPETRAGDELAGARTEEAAARGQVALEAAAPAARADRVRLGCILLGVALFALVYFAPIPAAAVDPQGKAFPLMPEGKAAIALFLLAGTWWITEVIPIGVTSIAIAVIQGLFLIRRSPVYFTDFMDPSVWFIFGSLMFGMVFTQTGLTRRMAYRMLSIVGERTSMIYLGCFVMTATLTLTMAHTAAAATVFPILLAVYALYTDDPAPTRFGKGLFMGMAFVAGAGSIMTLLGSARAAVAIGFYKEIAGRSIGFFELSYYLVPVGLVMTLLVWLFFLLYYPPEHKTIPGLRDRVRRLYDGLGPMTRNEKLALLLVLSTIALMGLRSFVPALAAVDKSVILLSATVLFFLFRIVSLEDLQGTSWNIILLFGGAMSLGFCLWQTGAAAWLAIHWLTLFRDAHWMVFVIGIAFFVLVMTNFIMNVAAIAITLPVALVMAPYLGVAPEVVLFVSLVVAGMPFLLLIGAAPNAIAYTSKQFTTREFLLAGIPASAMLLLVLATFVWVIWPAMGMPVLR